MKNLTTGVEIKDGWMDAEILQIGFVRDGRHGPLYTTSIKKHKSGRKGGPP